MNPQVIGTCGLCGGDVVRHTAYHSVVPPKPMCVRCGAVVKQPKPVLDMESQSRRDEDGEWYL